MDTASMREELWCAEFAWPPADGTPQVQVWQAVDAPMGRAYRAAASPPAPGDVWPWQRLQCLVRLPGASAGADAPFHYVVQTEVAPEHDADLNAWYAQEHLPGLAAVPGTVCAARYVYQAADGWRRYHACYDLVAPEVLASDAWLAVRATDWSSRVRPRFLRPTRQMYRRPGR